MSKRAFDDEDSDSEECARQRQRQETLKNERASAVKDAARNVTPEDFCVVSWNVDGINRFLTPENQITDYFKTASKAAVKTSLRQVLQRLNWPDVLALQEVKCYLKDVPRIAKSVTKDIAPKGPGYRLYHCLPGENLTGAQRERRFGHGSPQAGVFTLVKDTIEVDSHETVDWDDEGRVSILNIRHMRLYNLYLLNGSQSPYKDPRSGQVLCTRNERKREFNRKLKEEVAQQMSRKKSCLLVGDMNVSIAPIDCHPRLRTENEHALSRKEYIDLFFTQLELVDIIRHLYGPKARKFTWFSRNVPQGEDCARVDHILITTDLREGCRADTMENFDRLGSDHAPLYFVTQRP